MPDTGEAGAKDQATPSWSLGCLILLAAALIVSLVIYAFGRLRDDRPPVALTASTRDLTNLQDITMTGNAAAHHPVRWSLSGSLRQLGFSGPGTAMAILPLPIRDCQNVAAALDAACTGHQVRLRSPAAITWSSADLLFGTPLTQAATSLEVAPTRAGYLNLFPQGSRPPALCFKTPAQAAKLRVTQGNLHFTKMVPGFQPIECNTGLTVVIGSPDARISPLIEMGGISSATVTVSAPEALTQGFAGPIVLNPGGTSIIGSPSQVTMHAAGGAALHATISTGTGSQSLEVRSGAADRVITSAGELVPSDWARNSDIVVPVFGGVVTLAVAVLSGAAQELMAWVRGLRPDFRRLDLWLQGRLRSWLQARRRSWLQGRRRRPADGSAAPQAAGDNDPGGSP